MVKRSRIVAFFLLLLLFAGVMGPTIQGIVHNIKLGLDLQGGFEVLYEVKPAKKGDKIDQETLQSTVSALNKRINVLGVSEPRVDIEGGNRIRVQLAGVKDQNEAREILSTQAKLTFRDVNDNVLMDGSDLVQGGAKLSFDENGRPSVALKLKDADKFRQVTEKVYKMGPPNNILVIWLDFKEGVDSYRKEAGKADPKFISAASVNQVFNQTDVSIVGNFTVKEAQQLADLLNAGALPVELHEIYSTSVGAQFGKNALQKTVLAGIIGVAAIFLFMIWFYRLPGIIAVITLSVYIYLILLLFDWMNVVMTLPGIAALILGVGMAVDANIITYERIKEELKLGKSMLSAFRAGNRGSFATIFDANLTTIIAGAVLFIYGTSSVKGFATTLIISIVVSFLTAVYGTRLLLGLLVSSRWLDKKPEWFGVKKSEILNIAETTEETEVPTKFDRWDFVKHSKKFFIFSGALTIAGVISLFALGLNLGIDFTSGTRVEVTSSQPIDAKELSGYFERLGYKPEDVVLSGTDGKTGVVRLIGVLDKQEIAKLKNELKQAYGNEPNISTVSPVVGKQLARNALIAVLISSIGIILYVTIRFEWRMALAAIVALLHDAFFIITVFSLTRLEVDLTFIAAVLTIIGYSINDTIVTFDRIRDLMKKRKVKTVDDLKHIVNRALQQTFTRSVNTVLTVLFTVIALLIFGSEAIRNFNLALLVGLVCGVYSSLCIASQLWVVWKGQELKKGKGAKKAAAEAEPQV
ncbi:protein translocase subunit SecDF [Geobacillus sp. G4]|uniref:Multifunctional fusion protein n=1 Tax=Geobacillus thermoleovorans TaxID=33941 RepID=A0A1C3D6P9_GEOTH|nr:MULTISPECIES: protein translocase subunit SecDF [Geobacillus]AMV11772.1 preprotein translocase subunit SecD [Geobacillus thermoleovorans]AOL35296.1 protein translocase subunit SecDF [Geobacillus thermoleovorans]AWO75291.1 protein translocase subunit SecDF [Geobacillus thermoleovorans]MBW7641770.1 protein translocase subunit SecDF [Geobacillus thermoleovorans]ODA16671.1 protein translocase subunit SecDF [Geobacillus thermoleovorans]